MSAPPESGPLPRAVAPPGGFGAGAASKEGAPRFGPVGGLAGAPQDGGGKRWAPGVAAVTVCAVIMMAGTLGVLAVLFFNKYMVGTKRSEARNTVGQLAKDAVLAYEAEEELGPAGRANHGMPEGFVDHRLCPAASLPVPEDRNRVSGKEYQSTRADWARDLPQHAGFACLRFSIDQPQRYQYRYEATPTSFTAGGSGDLNGNGKFSDFRLSGEIKDARLQVTPYFSETDPEE